METGIPVSNTSFFDAFNEAQPSKSEERIITDDQKVYSLSKHEGWSIMKRFISAHIEDLRSKYAIKEGESLDVYAARRMAQDTAINYLESTISFVDNIANYVREEDEKRKQSEGEEDLG
jgi:hypothetical protein